MTDERFVSGGVVGDPGSCVFDALFTAAHGGLAKVFGWYGNEWGYSALALSWVYAARLCSLISPPLRREPVP